MKKLLIALAMIAGVASAPALTVDSTVSDHCVLQQNMDNYVKGTANANSTVTVKLGGTQIGSGKADSSGNFKVTIRPGAANATSRDLVVSDGSASKTISDVLVGEVWFVAGQSNAFNMMDSAVMSGDYATAYPQWREQFDCPNVRVVISTPTQACGGVSDYYAAAPSQSLNWIVCQKSNESNVKKISPLAFFFGKKLSAYKNCPVGIVLVGQGGTPIGYHMTAECSALAKTYYGGDFNWGDGISSGKNLSACYTRTDTIAARGVIWAQGETDGKISGDKYRHLLRALVENWRSRRNEPNFPFLIYGFANFDDEVEAEGDHKWPRVRWEQEKAVIDGLITPAAVFHAIDLSGSSQKGYAKSIHPDQKPELADRALLAARNLVYGENVAYRCPYPTQAYFNSSKDKVYVTFPSSVSLSMDGSYTHIPFRVKNTKMDGWGASVNPTSVTIGSDGHSLEVAFDTSKLTVNASDLNNSIDYCCVAGTEDTTWIYEQRIKDQNGFPMPPFCLNISNTSSGGDTHVHTWGTPTYTWSADNATCTATATCTGNSSHTASQTVSATLTVVTAATETTDGTGTRTAVFSSPFTTQTKTVTIPATGSGSGSGSGEQPGGQTGNGNANGHEYVQLWADGPAFAKCNVGASSETEFGLMFSYGSTVGTVKGTTTTFDDGCPTAGKTIAQLKSSNIIDANANLSMSYDAASVKMGGDWRMPTKAEIDALVSNCDCVYATVNGVKGTRVTGRGDFASATIFIPTCGYYNAGGSWGNEQFYGIYLTATAEDANMKVYTYILQQNVPFATGTGNRANGYPIRGVLSGASGSGSGSGSGGGDEPGGDTHTHTWGTPSYSWSSDNNSCTATASCTVSGCSQKNTKTVSSTYQVVLTPTETATGTGRYTATFTSPFTTQTKDVTIPKTGSGSSSGSGSAGGHEGVQLWANGPYWATMNCGATASTQSGYYYLNNTDTVGYAVKNGALTGALVRNSSTTLWGDGWRLPTTAEAKLIKDNCNIVSSGTDAAGQPYLVIQGKTSGYTDKTIIFPLGGYGNGGNVSASPNRWGTYGKYWTSDTGVANRLCVGLSSSGGYFEYANGGDVGHGNYYMIRLVRDTMPSGGGNTHTHTWGTPSYTWTETSSGWTCKARAVCTGDSSHVNEQTATATYAVITEATTTSTGLGRYTATFTDAAFATQTKDVTIPMKSDDPGGSGGSGDPTPAYDSADYYVSPTGSDSNNGTSRSTPFATIQKAVSVASSGKKICLLKGTYNVVNPSPYTDSAAIVLDKGVIVFGETGNPADVVVHNTKEWADNSNYNQTYRVFLLNDAGAVLSGVTVENGFVRGGQSEPKFFGGNILISSNGGRVENCVIRNGRIDTYQNATADPNTAGAGAAIACISANGLISHCVISNNLGSMGRTHSTKKNVDGSTIVWLKPGTLRQSLIVNNTIRQSWWGSIVHLGSAGALVENCTIANNKYDSSTVGNPGGWADSGELYPVNITLNSYDTGAAEGIVRNCVIVNNSGHSGNDLTAFTRYLDSTYGNTKKGVAQNNIINCATDCTLPTGATAVTSGFALGADFRPQAGSTLIDAGATMTSAVTTDLAGNARVGGSAVDIGCYEYGTGSSEPSHTHVWGSPSYTWTQTSSGYSCQGSASCTESGCTQKKTETVAAAYAVVTPATTSAAGLGRYTATFSDSVFSTQTKDVEIPKLHSHTYGTPTYTWSSDNKTCTASAQCTASGCSDTITETVNSSANVTQEPTTESTGTCIYTATFTNSKFTTQTKTVTLPKLPSGPDSQGIEYVQLWEGGPGFAKCNVGASSETDFGLMFSYGSTVGTVKGTTAAFDDGCPTAGKTIAQLKSSSIIDSNANLSMSYDAASVKMGGDWRMPTKAEIDDLISNCDVEYVTVNGVKGTRVTGRGAYASASIFIPTCGYYNAGGAWCNEQHYGMYLTATAEDANMKVYTYALQQNVPLAAATGNRANGYPIRGVLPGATGSGSGTGGDVDPGDGHTHSWGSPSYNWSSDNRTCTASASCTVSGCTQVKSETVTAAYVVVTPATGSTTGVGRYTATFSDSLFTTQTKTVTLPISAGPDSQGIEYVQLWEGGPGFAKCNVGASSETAFGLMFSYGSTVGTVKGTTAAFDDGCPTAGKTIAQLKSSDIIDSDGNLTMSYDAASVKMGGDWRMPTKAEIDDLISNCDVEYVTENGVKGTRVTGRGAYASATIFIPTCGYYNAGGAWCNEQFYGMYLTATAENANMKVYTYALQQPVPLAAATGNRANGYPIRGVITIPDSGSSGTVDWDHPVATIDAATSADAAWPVLANSALSKANASKLQVWAKNVGKVPFESADGIKLEAFLLNCDNTDSAIEAAKAEFKFASFDPDNLPTPSDFASKGYNGVVRIEGCNDLVSDSWGSVEDGDHFFRAVITLE